MTTVEADVARRMEIIMQIFTRAQAIAANETDFGSLALQLDETENEFRSVAYEAVSMTIALHEFENGMALNRWFEFRNGIGRKHASQVHSGLGWAIAKRKISPTEILEKIDPLLQLKIIDGCGYYDGIFRQRFSISEKIIPLWISSAHLLGYDQGIGRSLYYNCKGVVEKLREMIDAFPASRHADLWRGIGMACIYVGGSDEKMLRDLNAMAGEHAPQLSVSAALVSRARHEAGAVTPYVQSACTYLCRSQFGTVLDVTQKTASIVHQDDSAYRQWILAIAVEFSAKDAAGT